MRDFEPAERIGLLFIGLDGVPFDLCNDMMAQGRLPNLARLASSGAFGQLNSSIPPHTAPAWTSMFTGVGPGEHGMYQFWNLKDADYRMDLMSSGSLGWRPVWRELARNGLSVGVCNVPMTHPPEALPGWMISWPLGPTLSFAEPHDVLHDLAAAGLRYHPDVVAMWAGSEAFPHEALAGIEQRCKALRYLMEHRRTDAVFCVFTEFDRIAHYHWSDAGPSEIVLTALERLDACVGRLVRAVQDDTDIVVASDHGFGPCRGNVQINQLLVEAGLMAETSHEKRPDDPAAAHLGTAWSGPPQASYVDWFKTRAYMPSPGCYGINLNRSGRQRCGTVEVADIPFLRKDIEAALAQLTASGQGPCFDLVDAASVYQGHRIDDGPDFLIVPDDWAWMAHPGLSAEILTRPTQPGVHRPEGIVLISSPKLSGPIAQTARVEDICPTLLSLCDLASPNGAEGRALGGLPDLRGPDPHWRLRLQNSAAAMTSLAEKQLANMGYL